MLLLFTTVFLLAAVNASPTRSDWKDLDCSDDSCFAEPHHCNTQTTCRSLLKFHDNGNVDLYLRDFTDKFSFASFIVDHRDNDTADYLLCIPHVQQRLRATAKLGSPINIINRNMTRFVRRFGKDDFVCQFPADEISASFRRERSFFVSIGKFVDDLVIYDGKQLFGFEDSSAEYDDDEDEDDEDDTSLQTIPVSGKLSKDDEFQVFSQKDSKLTSRAIESISRIAEDEDSSVENIASSSSKRRPAKKDDDLSSRRRRNGKSKSDSEDEDDEEEERRPARKNRRRDDDDDEIVENRKRSRKSSRLDDDEDEDEDYEDEDKPKSKSKSRKNQKNRKNSRSMNDEDDEDMEDDDDMPKKKSKGKKNHRRNEEDEDEDLYEDDYEDDDDSSNIAHLILSIVLPLIVLFF